MRVLKLTNKINPFSIVLKVIGLVRRIKWNAETKIERSTFPHDLTLLVKDSWTCCDM